MAKNPEANLIFKGKCPDCGRRVAKMPGPLPDPGDDFDWLVRDYAGFRQFMLEELAARFSERSRWTAADLEMVVVEAFAAVLDQFSDMLDRTFRETFLETAQRPESVRRLLKLIGYDALALAKAGNKPPFDQADAATETRSDAERFDRYWLARPRDMEEARREGPRSIRTQRRMVTEQDYAYQLEKHPLVLRAHAYSRWSGSWTTIQTAVILRQNAALEESLNGDQADLKRDIDNFHKKWGLSLPVWEEDPPLRSVLRNFVEAWRMAGQEVVLRDAEPVGIIMALSLRIAENYYHSEIHQAAEVALGQGDDGFFRPGRLRFGEDIHASDIFQTLMGLDGVEAVCLNRFKRAGRRYANQADSGRIMLDGLEYGICENDRNRPERGFFTLRIHGGKKG
jgi:hypothetical protein